METSSEIGQEQEQDDHHENTAFKKRLLHVADRTFDETALAENISRHFHVGRQVLLEVFQRGFQFVGQFEGTSGRLFGDCH